MNKCPHCNESISKALTKKQINKIKVLGLYGYNIERAAESIGLKTRTLQRYLAATGTTFLDLVEAEKKDKAAFFLRDQSVCIKTVAECLGYSDTSSFYIAFKKWYGKTPKQYMAGL